MMEAIVFGKRAVDKSWKYVKKIKKIPSIQIGNYNLTKEKDKEIHSKIKKIMWKHAGIIRNEKQLWDGLNELNKLQIKFENAFEKKVNKEILEIRNMLIVSKEIIRSALKRKKSLGCHYLVNQKQ